MYKIHFIHLYTMIYAGSVMPGGTLSGKVVRLLPLTRMLLVIRRIFGHFLLFMLKVLGRSTPFWCWARFYFRIFLFAVYINDTAELFSIDPGVRIVVCADDSGIILVTSSVSVFQKALEISQCELANLRMSINAKKTCCLRIGPRANA